MIKRILDKIYPLLNFNVILADGQFPKDQYLQSLLGNANKLIACDGAINQLIKHNINPDYIIGDCDSIPSELYDRFKSIITRIEDQNLNDLTKAINMAKDLNLDNIVILGATGKREDHTIGNIALLIRYSSIIKNIAIISDYGIFTIASGITHINTLDGQQISLFSPIPNTIVNCQQLKWPLSNYQFKLWNNGTLNEAIGDNIVLSSNSPIIVYRAF